MAPGNEASSSKKQELPPKDEAGSSSSSSSSTEVLHQQELPAKDDAGSSSSSLEVAQRQQLPVGKVILRTADKEEFEVDVEDAMQSGTLKSLIEEDGLSGVGGGSVIPLPNVTGPVLAKVLEFFRRHRKQHRREKEEEESSGKEGPPRLKDTEEEEELRSFDREFMRVADRDLRFELMLAANYLDAKQLLDVTCQAVADEIKEMAVTEVRDYFGLENDFTPEEEAALRKEHEWAFE